MKKIFLTGKNGGVALVDDEDYEELNKYKWYGVKTGSNGTGGPYACRSGPRNEDPRRKIYMHRVIMNCPKGMEVDHGNHKTLDNRKCNLENVTKQENKYRVKGVDV